MQKYFSIHPKIKIPVPALNKPWEMYTAKEKELILAQWENIRGSIPDYVQKYERQIETIQERLDREENFEKSCKLNEEISQLASIINEMWIYYRKEGFL